MKFTSFFFSSIVFYLFLSCSTNDSNSPILSSMEDVDGNKYTTVKIGTQTWMQSNLNVSHYRNGAIIPYVQDPNEWYNLTTGAWCYYEHLTENGIVYGKLYNWYAVNDSRGLAPEGWHIPNQNDIVVLRSSLGSNENAGGKMKSKTTDWIAPNVGANNDSYFTALPGGYRSNGGGFYDSKGIFAYFWTSSFVNENSESSYTYLIQNNSAILYTSDDLQSAGHSVRCVKD